jgi:hypothetical protein
MVFKGGGFCSIKNLKMSFFVFRKIKFQPIARQNIPHRQLFLFSTKLTSMTAFFFVVIKTYLSDRVLVFVYFAKLTSETDFFFPSAKLTLATVFCQNCFRLWRSDYKERKNYWAQPHLFPVIKLKFKKTKKKTISKMSTIVPLDFFLV